MVERERPRHGPHPRRHHPRPGRTVLLLRRSEFRILYTPGHSAGHICTVTPDNVCYVADALLSHELLEAKLPYYLSQQDGHGQPGEAARPGL